MVWPLICGAAVAQRTQVLNFHEGVLRIAVPDAAWRTQLAELAPRYLAVLNEAVPGAVTRIEFVVQATQ